jgi:hypothetical protein
MDAQNGTGTVGEVGMSKIKFLGGGWMRDSGLIIRSLFLRFGFVACMCGAGLAMFLSASWARYHVRVAPRGQALGGSLESSTPPSQQVPADAPNPVAANSAQSPKSADDDFHARCHAPGVIKCEGWDDPSAFIPAAGGGGYADGLYPASDGSYQGRMDTTNKTSGAGSLMFVIRPRVTANWTGYWRANFGKYPNLTSFGPHSTLYLQFRLRLDPNMLKFRWNTVSNEGWKVFIAYGPIPGPSCTGAQFVQENTYQTNVATAYVSCGNPALYSHDGVPPMLIQQGDYNCRYRHDDPYAGDSSCFNYPANTWMTEYWIVEIGDFGKPNTHFTAFIAPQGKPLKRFIDLANFTFNKDPSPGDALMTMLLQPYMSGADGTKTNPTAYMWFDELIISTNAIAAPKN